MYHLRNFLVTLSFQEYFIPLKIEKSLGSRVRASDLTCSRVGRLIHSLGEIRPPHIPQKFVRYRKLSQNLERRAFLVVEAEECAH